MIIKQYADVIRESKKETRRTSTNDTYKVGHVYCVVPKRAKPTVWYKWEDTALYIWHEYHPSQPSPEPHNYKLLIPYKRLQVRILAKRWEPLQDITEQGAIDEGIRLVHSNSTTTPIRYQHGLSNALFLTAVEAYSHLWDLINGKSKEFCWAANPLVSVHRFELVE